MSRRPQGQQARETLQRSLQMAQVQRKGLVVVLLAMVLSVPGIGWPALLPLVGSFVAFVVMKIPKVQRWLGVWSLVLIWTLGNAGIIGGVLLSANRPEYLIGMVALPAILGSVVWPRRWVIAASVVTPVLILLVGLAAGPAHFAHHPAPFAFAAAIGASMALLTLIARDAEAASREGTRIDPLTGVGNRVALAELRQRLDADPNRGPVAVVVIDVDHFKQVNDRHGHEAGDETLKQVAAVITQTVGDAGEVFRFGGEEFVAVLRQVDVTTAVAMAEQVRVGIADARGTVAVTASVGVAHSTGGTADLIEELFAVADARLYRAKRQGRDRVVSDGGPRADDALDAPGAAAPTPPVESAATWAPVERAPGAVSDTGDGVRRALARLHLISMSQRQYRHNLLIYLLLVAVLLGLTPIIGWAALVPAGVGAAVYRVTQRFVHRYRRPERVLGAAWLFTQATNGLALTMTARPALSALSVLALMVVASSAAYPLRHTVAGATYTVGLIVAVGLMIDPHVFTVAPESVMTAIALTICAAITGHAVGRLATSMRSEASHDQLTGLPNSVACAATAAALMMRWHDDGTPCAVLVGDLDHFKDVNDTAGHIHGDAVLVSLVRRLSENLRGNAMVFRTGGEEFAVLLSGVHAPEAVQLAERLRRAVEADPLAGQAITISFGVAVAQSDDGVDFGNMFRRADTALYAAKSAGRNCVRLADGWSPTVRDAIRPPDGSPAVLPPLSGVASRSE